jgi:hypothetical protein
MRLYKQVLGIMIIIIIVLSLILWLFANEEKFLDQELLNLSKQLNRSNNEYITKCYNGSYIIVRPTDFFICDSINPNITLDLKQ